MQAYSPVRQFSFIQNNLEQILGTYDFWKGAEKVKLRYSMWQGAKAFPVLTQYTHLTLLSAGMLALGPKFTPSRTHHT